jgi:hypothetical protein
LGKTPKGLRSAAENAADVSYRNCEARPVHPENQRPSTTNKKSRQKQIPRPPQRAQTQRPLGAPGRSPAGRHADELPRDDSHLVIRGASQDAVCGPTRRNDGWGTRKTIALQGFTEPPFTVGKNGRRHREGKIKIRTLETDPSQAQCKPFEAQGKRVRHPASQCILTRSKYLLRARRLRQAPRTSREETAQNYESDSGAAAWRSGSFDAS